MPKPVEIPEISVVLGRLRVYNRALAHLLSLSLQHTTLSRSCILARYFVPIMIRFHWADMFRALLCVIALTITISRKSFVSGFYYSYNALCENERDERLMGIQRPSTHEQR